MSSVLSRQVLSGQRKGSPSKLHHLPTAAAVALVPASPPRHEVRAATAGDHYAIFEFLTSIFQAPSVAEFNAQMDEPSYEPADRLLIKQQEQIVAHVRQSHREMRFGPLTLPVTGLCELATRRESRSQGCASALINEAEQQMLAAGSVLGYVRTTSPELFARQGWVPWSRHSYSVAGTREILARLSERRSDQAAAFRSTPVEEKQLPITSRIWRHVELAALRRCYLENTEQAFGPLVRSDDYWHWLMSRHAFERIYVAIEGRDRMDLNSSQVVGYAIVKHERIVELMTSGGRPETAISLLTRICGDCLERDANLLRIDAPADSQLHRLFVEAGGEFRHGEQEAGQVLMAKVLEPLGLLARVLPLISARAKRANLLPTTELGLHVGEKPVRILVTRAGLRIVHGRAKRCSVTCSPATLAQILLGHLDTTAAPLPPDLKFSTRAARDLTATLLPALPLWRPTFDELLA